MGSIFRVLKNNPVKIIILLLLVIFGVATKFYHGVAGGFVNNYLGGVVYVIFWILFFSLWFPGVSALKITAWVFIATCLIEVTQLSDASFLERLREYFVVRTLIGTSFNLPDMLFYLAGALLGYGMLVYLDRRNRKLRTPEI